MGSELFIADFTPGCLHSIWFGNWCSGGSICPDTCLDLFPCCLSNKQGNIVWFTIHPFNFLQGANIMLIQYICRCLHEWSLLLVKFYQLLDRFLGKDHDALYRRAELKTLVDLHSNEVFIFTCINKGSITKIIYYLFYQSVH